MQLFHSLRHERSRIVLCLCSCFVLSVSPAAAQERLGTEWQIMMLDGQRIGYASLETRRNGELINLRQKSKMQFRRFGQSIKIETDLQTEETEAGDLKSFRFEIRNPPSQPTISTGIVQGSRLELELTVNGRKSEKSISITKGLKSPLWQERMFHDVNLRGGTSANIETWLPELSKTSRLKFQIDEARETKLFDGQRERLFKVHVQNSALPTLKTRGYLDADGMWRKSESDFFNKTLTTYQVSEEEALQEIAGNELDLALQTIVRVSGLRDAHRYQQVTYRITLETDNPADYFESGPLQSVKPVDEHTILLTVKKASLPARTVVKQEPGDAFLDANEFLQVEDQRIQQLARRTAAGDRDPIRIAQKMEKAVYELVDDKNFSTALASAAEVAEKREGDCTEHAMLLAAMLRASGLPSRIAVGFVHSDSLNGFGGHMWTEVWLRDRWYPLDATLANGGIGAGHLKISDSSLDENSPAPITSFLPMLQLIGQMSIEVENKR